MAKARKFIKITHNLLKLAIKKTDIERLMGDHFQDQSIHGSQKNMMIRIIPVEM